MYYVINESYLMHHGIKGQKWGIRRYQNPDGTLTSAGRVRYFKDETRRLASEYDKNKGGYTARGNIKRRLDREKYVKEHYNGNFKKDLNNYRVRHALTSAALASLALVGIGALAITKSSQEKTAAAADNLYHKTIYNAGDNFDDAVAVYRLSRTGSEAKERARKDAIAYANTITGTSELRSKMTDKEFIKAFGSKK